MCGEMWVASCARPRDRAQHRPRALPGKPSAAGVEEQGRCGPAGGGQLRAGADQIGLDRVPRIAADGHDPLLSTLTTQQHCPGVQVQIVAVQPDSFGDPRARPVEHLEERPVPQGERSTISDRGGHEPLDVLE